MMGDIRPDWAVRLQIERERREWSKPQMARELYAAVGVPNIDPHKARSLARQVLGWEKGDHFPQAWSGAYATAFDMTEAELFGDELEKPNSSPGSTVGVHARVRDEWDDDMYRRAALQLLTALSAGAAIPAGTLETVLSTIGRTLDDRADLDVAGWQETVWEYKQFFRTSTPGTLIGDMTADLVSLGRLLDRTRDPQARAHLLRASADLTELLAFEFGDISQRRAARQSWRTARQAADATGDHDFAARMRAAEAYGALWSDRPDALISRLIDEAIGLAPQASNSLANAYATQAIHLALRGDPSADAALDRCAAVLDQRTDTFDRSWYVKSAAHVRTVTGSRRAAADVEQALALTPANQAGPLANLRLVRALHLVKDREIGEGLNYAMSSARGLPLSAERRVIAGQILDALPDGKARELPAARDLHALTAGETVA